MSAVEEEAELRLEVEPVDSVRAGIAAGLSAALPMLLIGMSFGVAARDAGWGIAAPVVMSLLTFGGAGQLAVLTTLAAGGTVVAAVLAGALINLRFLAVGMAIGPSFSGGKPRRAALAQTLLDSSLILARIGPARFGVRRLLGSTLPQWAGWQCGTVIGVLAAGAIGDPARFGIDALFPAFFLALMIGELRDSTTRSIALLAAVIALVAIPTTAPGIPVIAACFALAILLVRK